MAQVAHLGEAVFKLRLAAAGQVDADFVLTLRTTEGTEQWDFGWNLRDARLESAGDRALHEVLDPFMRSLFDDHMSDLAERGLTADRGYDDLAIRVEVPDVIAEQFA